MRRLSSILLGVIFLGLLACSSAPYTTKFDYRKDVDFNSYKTYSWMSDSALIRASVDAASPLLEVHLKRATKSAMDAKGYVFEEDPEKADIVLSFTVGARDKIKVNSYPVAYQHPFDWGGPYWGGGFYAGTQTQVRQYTEGTLSLDIFDVKMREPVWHSRAVAVLKDRSKEEDDALLNQLMVDMLSKFPPPQYQTSSN